MRVIRLLSLRRLRLQPLRAVLAAIVVGAGTSLVVSILVITASLERSLEDAGRALAGPAPLRVIGPLQRGGIDEATVLTVEAVEGVSAAVPIIQSVTVVDDGRDEDDIPVTVLGFDCRAQAILEGVQDVGCTAESLAALTVPLVGPGLSGEVASGADVRTQRGRMSLTGAIVVPGLGSINSGDVIAFPMPMAQRELARDGRFDLVYVLPDEGRSVAEVQQAVRDVLPPDHVVVDSTEPPPVIGVVLATFLPLFTVIAVLTLGIGAVLVRNSITLSLEERRRQTAIVAALGGSGRLVVGGTIVEVTVLGAVGGALGVGGGTAIAHPISGGLDEVTRSVAGIPLEIAPSSSAIVVGILVGVVVAVGAAIGPARRAARVDVAGELANRGRRDDAAAARSPWRLVAGLGVMAVGVGLAATCRIDGGLEPWQATSAPLGFLIVSMGSVYVVATATPLALGALERTRRVRRAPLQLAIANLRREPRRTGVMAIAIGFAMGVGFVTASFNDSVALAITDSLNDNLDGVQVAAVEPGNGEGEARLSEAVLDGLAAIPEVDRVDTGAFVVVGNEGGKLTAAKGFTDAWLNDPIAVGTQSLDQLKAGEVVIGPGLARSEGLRPGDELRLATPTGPVRLPVAAVVFNGEFGGRGVLMDYDLLIELYGPQAPLAVVAVPRDGVSETELIRAIEEADLDPKLVVEGRQDVIDRNVTQVSEQLSTFLAIQRGLLVMSFIAVLSTLLLVGIQRQKEFGMLAAVGMTPAEMRGMVLIEAALVGVLGVVITGLAAVVQYTALWLIVPVMIGYKDPFVVDLSSMAVYSLIAIATAVVAGIYPSRRAGRVEVLEALRYE